MLETSTNTCQISFKQDIMLEASTNTRRTGSWELKEDQKLQHLVSTLGVKNWKHIGIQHGWRDGKQCRERWTNHLDPQLLYTPISPEEDLKILAMYKEFNTKWAEMGKRLKRPANMVKNRFYSKLYKRAEKKQHEKKWCNEVSRFREGHVREKDGVRKVKRDGKHLKRSNDAETRRKKGVENKSKEERHTYKYNNSVPRSIINPASETIFPAQPVISDTHSPTTTPIYTPNLSTSDNISTYLYPNSYNVHHKPSAHSVTSSCIYHEPSQAVNLIPCYVPLTPPYTPSSPDTYVEKSNWISTGLCNDKILADKVKMEVKTRMELGHNVIDSLMQLADVAVEEKEKLANSLLTRNLNVMSIDTLLN
ncbi:507_t:CDS:2 [Paraglomus brasilianum]|uniref:507_t:CDS:1 n=1 Tax=Paraglomus brasilianum TaxID=144538 RepID=A0A9N8ZPF3_9GLOM|nr:507_t:CDS:2 [Paraglomus brasilianum]